jgi:hypothetical protein
MEESHSQFDFQQPTTKVSKKHKFNTIIIIFAIVVVLVLLFLILSSNKQPNVGWIDAMIDPKNLVKIAKDV